MCVCVCMYHEGVCVFVCDEGVVEFERDKNFGNLFLAKLKMALTFAPCIKMTIIIYASGVEKNFPYYGVSQTRKISCLLSFFFKYYCPIFLNFA